MSGVSPPHSHIPSGKHIPSTRHTPGHPHRTLAHTPSPRRTCTHIDQGGEGQGRTCGECLVLSTTFWYPTLRAALSCTS